jgi:penicillin-binding protein 1A
MGYDTPRKLGDTARETGGGLSLPIWISFMETALKGVPETEYTAPEGVLNIGGEWFYDEFANGTGVRSLGLEDANKDKAESSAPAASATGAATAPADEKKTILDLFKN